jgi:hypothetical protein
MPVELEYGTRDHETNVTEDEVSLIGFKLYRRRSSERLSTTGNRPRGQESHRTKGFLNIPLRR